MPIKICTDCKKEKMIYGVLTKCKECMQKIKGKEKPKRTPSPTTEISAPSTSAVICDMCDNPIYNDHNGVLMTGTVTFKIPGDNTAFTIITCADCVRGMIKEAKKHSN